MEKSAPANFGNESINPKKLTNALAIVVIPNAAILPITKSLLLTGVTSSVAIVLQ